MRRVVWRVLLVVGMAFITLLLVAAAAGYWFLTRSHPQTSGALLLPGLKNKVEVIRDRNGVPHIYADNLDDLFLAQGFVHAQDRLWQMELNRRIGYGRLAELFGADWVDEDKFLRTLGLARAAQRDWDVLTPELQQVLAHYAAGVNAYIHSRRDNLPLEFVLLNLQPEPWQPIDTLVWGKVMAYDLSDNYDRELLRVALRRELGEAAMRALIPEYPAAGPFILPSFKPTLASHGPSLLSPENGFWKTEKGNFGGHPQTPGRGKAPALHFHPKFSKLLALHRQLGLRGNSIGSNNWVLAGAKTTTGQPLLANDPHLRIQMPAIWYVNGLHCHTPSEACWLNVVGYTFPGVPGVIIGHNDRIAWGVTNARPDVQDLYVEKINPANPNQYEYMGRWEEIQRTDEVIRVKGSAEVRLTVRSTRHGPLLNEVVEGVSEPLALQWTAIREPSTIFQAAFEIMRAHNWDEFRAALRNWDVPAQNFVYADVEGNIGYQLPGRIPLRRKGDGTVPVPGWTDEYEWVGYIPFDQLPMALNPSEHYILTANNQIVPNDYPYLLTRDWAAPFRAARIAQLIGASDKLSPDDIQRIQGDLYSLPLVKLQKYIVPLPTDNFLTRRALEYVKTWDGIMSADSVAATILESTYRELVHQLLAKRLSEETFEMYASDGDAPRMFVDALLDDPQNEWWDDPATPTRETRDDRLKAAYAAGVDALGKQFGDWPPDWKWGRVHFAVFAHPFGEVKPLDLIFNVGPIPTGGNGYTVWNAAYREGSRDAPPRRFYSFVQRAVASMRFIADLSDWNRSQWMLTTGQSGQPLSPHYADLVSKWSNLQNEALPFTREAVEQVKAEELILTP